MKKLKFHFFLIIFSSLIYTGCGIFKITPPMEKKVVKFDYSPPEGSTQPIDIGLVLISPSYAEGFEDSKAELFRRFIKSMGADFEEMIIARGFRITEPISSMDELTYSEKQNTDLYLRIEVDLNFDPSSNALKSYYSSLSKSHVYSIDGEVTLSGKVNMSALETMTQQKIWAKSIPMDDATVYVKSEKNYSSPNIPIEDTGVHNAIVDALEEIYAKSLTTAWRHLDPNEFVAMKSQIKEVREKKAY